MSNKNKHQLIYCICESTEHCKELFELAKANGVTTNNLPYLEGDLCLLLEVGVNNISFLITTNKEDCKNDGATFMLLPDFISLLQNKWEQPDEVAIKLPKKVWEEIQGILSLHNDNMSPSYKHDLNELIYEQLSQQP
jgi:hypothetical protein